MLTEEEIVAIERGEAYGDRRRMSLIGYLFGIVVMLGVVCFHYLN